MSTFRKRSQTYPGTPLPEALQPAKRARTLASASRGIRVPCGVFAIPFYAGVTTKTHRICIGMFLMRSKLGACFGRLDALQAVNVGPGQTTEAGFVLGDRLEEFSASRNARSLESMLDRYGADAENAKAADWCRSRTRTTGRPDLDLLMNRNYLFATAAGYVAHTICEVACQVAAP